MTRRPGRSTSNDPGLAALLEAKADAICFVAKSWDFHVRVALETTPRKISPRSATACARPRRKGREVLLDCEHFFDGYKANPQYRARLRQGRLRRRRALGRALRHQWRHAAARGREDRRRGGQGASPASHVGIHAHNDTEQAVANSLAAVRAGARQIQGTLNGLGERCGNANLVSIIPTLKLKREFAERFEIGVSDAQLKTPRACLARARRDAQPRAQPARALCRRKRVRDQGRHSCLGDHEGARDLRARAARGGRQPAQAPGLRPGRASNVLAELERIGLKVDKDDPRIARLLDEVKEREAIGYAYEAADASFELLARRVLGKVPNYFDVEKFDVNVEQRDNALGKRVDRVDGGGEGEGRRRASDLGGGRQRPGQRARSRAAQGPGQVPELYRAGSSSPTTACASSTAAPRR